MVSARENLVRKLDNKTKSIVESARNIAEQLNISLRTTEKIIRCKRRGFNSTNDYHISILKKSGLNNWTDALNYWAENRGFKDHNEYEEYIAQKNGFINLNEYNMYLRYKSKGKFKNKRDFQERDGFVEDLEYQDPKFLDNILYENDYSLLGILEQEDKKEEIKNILDKSLEKLDENSKRVIIERFYEGKTLNEIGSQMNFTRQRVEQIEKDALRKLYYLAKRSGLYDLYAEKD